MAHIAGSSLRSRLATLLPLLVLLFAALSAGAPKAVAADEEHPFISELSLLETFVEACGATTDPYGNIYVADLEGGVSVFDPSGDQLTEFTPFDLGGIFAGCSLAVDRVGAVYLTSFDFPANSKVAKYRPVGGEFPPTASTEYELDETVGDEGVIVEARANAVAVDHEAGDLFVAEAGINEQQELVFPTAAQCAPGTKLKLTYVPTGQTSADELVCGASEGAIRAALQAMLGDENVTARGATPTKTIEFTGVLGNTDIPAGAIEVREVGTGTLRATSTAKVAGVPSGISVYSPAGADTGQKIGADIPAAAYFGVDVDAANERLYAVDQQHAVVYVFDLSGATATLIATVDGTDRYSGGFADLGQAFVAADEASGNFYVNNVGLSFFEDPTDANGVIAQFTPAGDFVSQIGPTFGEDELEFESEIYAPIGLTVDDGGCSPNRGNVYVAANWENLYAFGPTSPYTPSAPTVTAVEPSEGPTTGGVTVTIAGTGLGCADLPGGAVEFGDAPAAAVEVDATGTEMTATAPAHAAGTVNVTVTTPNGSSSPTAAGEYTYVVPPTLTGCTPTAGPLSGGPQVTCTGTNLSGASFEFGAGNQASGVIVNEAGTEATMSPPSAPEDAPGAVAITATTAGGTAPQTIEYTYVAPPSLAVVKGGTGTGTVECDGALCEASYPYGTSVTLDAIAAADSTFGGWSGACTGTAQCVVTVDADTAVTATFTASPTSPQPTPDPPPTTPDLAGKSRLLGDDARVSDGKAAVRISCAGPGACTGLLRLKMKVKRNGRTRRVTIGSARFALAEGEAKTVEVRLSARARKRLAKQGRIRVRATGPALNATLTLRVRR